MPVLLKLDFEIFSAFFLARITLAKSKQRSKALEFLQRLKVIFNQISLARAVEQLG